MDNRKLTLCSFLVVACVLTTGCSTTMLNGDEFRISGSSKGIRAFGDWMTGQQVVAKTAPESLPSNPHHAMRANQETSVLEEIRSRFMLNPQEVQK